MEVTRDNQFFAAFLEGNQPLVSVAGEHKTTLREFVAWARSSRISTALQDFRDLFALREEMVSIQARTTAIAAIKRIVETSYNQVEVRRAAVVLARFTTRPKPRPNNGPTNGPTDGPSNGPDDNPNNGPTPTQPTPHANSPEPAPPEPSPPEPNSDAPIPDTPHSDTSNPHAEKPDTPDPASPHPAAPHPEPPRSSRLRSRLTTLDSRCVSRTRSPPSLSSLLSPDSRFALSHSLFSLLLHLPDSLIPRAAFSAFPDSRFATPDSRCLTPDSRFATPDSRCFTPDSRLTTPDVRCLKPNLSKF